MTAAFTLVRNEPFFLPLWVAYYASQFGTENLFVLDHGSDDGSTDGLPCEVVPIGADALCYDHEWMCATVSAFQADLLYGGYDIVFFGDVDEFLWHPQGLRRFAVVAPGNACRATGYNLAQGPGEVAYNAARPIMEQRGWWARRALYDKTLVAREPLRWKPGFHFLANGGNAEYAEGLTLVHLHGFDREQARARHAARMGWRWNEGDKALERGLQWTLEGAELEAWLDDQAAGAVLVDEVLREAAPF